MSEKITGNFQRTRSATLAPGATVDIITEQYFGSAVKAIITAMSNYIDDASGWGQVEFEIICDGRPHEEFGSFYDAMGTQEKLREIPRGFLQANNHVIVRLINHHGANTYNVGYVLQGDYVQKGGW